MVHAVNNYPQSMESRIANYFAKAQPGLDAEVERGFVSMIMDIADLLAKWDLIAEERSRRKLRGQESTVNEAEIQIIKDATLERIKKMSRFEDNGKIHRGTVNRQLVIIRALLERTATHFENEIELLERVKLFCLSNNSSENKEKIVAGLRRLQYEKSTAYVTDYDFARALISDPLLPNSPRLLDAWAFAHECVHDIREWKHDLNNSIFNYFLILAALSMNAPDERRRFFEGYMLSSAEASKSSCETSFRNHSDMIITEFQQLNVEIDVLRTFLDDLLVGAFDDTVANIEKHLSR
jgi:hypothetical protein